MIRPASWMKVVALLAVAIPAAWMSDQWSLRQKADVERQRVDALTPAQRQREADVWVERKAQQRALLAALVAQPQNNPDIVYYHAPDPAPDPVGELYIVYSKKDPRNSDLFVRMTPLDNESSTLIFYSGGQVTLTLHRGDWEPGSSGRKRVEPRVSSGGDLDALWEWVHADDAAVGTNTRRVHRREPVSRPVPAEDRKRMEQILIAYRFLKNQSVPE